MTRSGVARWGPVTLGLVAVLAGWGWAAAADECRYSGTVVALDRATGTIMVGVVGPWRLEGGQTVVTRRTVAVTDATVFTRARREPKAEWPGGWVEVAVPAWSARVGDFVTVACERAQGRLAAVKVAVAELDRGSLP